MDTVDNFEEQLALNRHRLILSMEKIQEEYIRYRKKRLIDHKFVQ